MYFANFDPEIYLTSNRLYLDSLFKVFVKSEKTDVPKFYAANILKLLCSYYLKGQRWYMLKNAFNEVENEADGGLKIIGKDSLELEYLHYEFGIGKDYLWEKLNNIVDSNYQLSDI